MDLLQKKVKLETNNIETLCSLIQSFWIDFDLKLQEKIYLTKHVTFFFFFT